MSKFTWQDKNSSTDLWRYVIPLHILIHFRWPLKSFSLKILCYVRPVLLLIIVSLSSVSFEMKVVCVLSIGTGKKSGLCINLKLAEYKHNTLIRSSSPDKKTNKKAPKKELLLLWDIAIQFTYSCPRYVGLFAFALKQNVNLCWLYVLQVLGTKNNVNPLTSN